MSDIDFDTALVGAALRLAGEQGWASVNVAAAARAAVLPVAEARARFAGRTAILLRFGRLADQAALLDAPSDGPPRDRLFDLLMRRFDALQAHRDGVKAVLRALALEPANALMVASATRASMRWMLQAAGVTATGPLGALQVRGLVAVWLYGVRAWLRDDTDDLSGTMAAIDAALRQAERIAAFLPRDSRPVPPPPPAAVAGAGELDPSDPASADNPAALADQPPPTELPPDTDPPHPAADP